MAWQYPTHICGHTGERYQAYGPNAGRQRQLAAIERRECPECARKAADELATQAGLPPLKGSDKQIAWAGKIRDRANTHLSADLMDKLRGETGARFWIDNRERIERMVAAVQFAEPVDVKALRLLERGDKTADGRTIDEIDPDFPKKVG